MYIDMVKAINIPVSGFLDENDRRTLLVSSQSAGAKSLL
jgi:hypothetical protein